jgi:hypothetical protein
MRRVIRACLVAALTCAIACGPKTVHPPNVASWELRGSVEAISTARLEVRHKSGRVIELVIDDRTEVFGTAGKEPWAAVAPGMRVAVQVETGASGAYRARSLRVFD